MDIIPAMDIIDGHCVRLSQGDYSDMRSYSANPLEMARIFESAGLKRLHLVDLDGAKGNGIRNLRVLEKIANGTSLIIDFGGGIKRREDLLSAFNAGASYVTCGSIGLESGEDDVIDFIKSYENKGFGYVIATDIARDGMLSGPSFSLYEKIMEASLIPLIASGGISSKEDLVALSSMGLSGAIVGKAYYEGYITLGDMMEVANAC